MLTVLRRVLLLAFACWFVACALLFATQRSLLYPRVAARPLPPEAALPLRAADGTQLCASVRLQPGAPAVLYLGGNGEDAASALARLAAVLPGHALYAPHYRGYGCSGGEPTEAALQADALALFDAIAARHPRVLLVGRSLGSGIAVRIAARRTVARLLLITPYDSIAAVAGERFPWAPGWLVLDRYDAAALAPRVRAPTAVWIATHDRVITRARTDALLARLPGDRVEVRVFQDAGHNDLSSHPDFAPALRAFGGAPVAVPAGALRPYTTVGAADGAAVGPAISSRPAR